MFGFNVTSIFLSYDKIHTETGTQQAIQHKSNSLINDAFLMFSCQLVMQAWAIFIILLSHRKNGFT